MTRATAVPPQHPSALDALVMAQNAAEGCLSDATHSPPTLSPAASSLASPGGPFSFPAPAAAGKGKGQGGKGKPSADEAVATAALTTLLKAASAVSAPVGGSAATTTASSPSSAAPSPVPPKAEAEAAEAASRLGCLFAVATSASAQVGAPPAQPQPLQQDRAAGAFPADDHGAGISSGSSTSSGSSLGSSGDQSAGRAKRPLLRGAASGAGAGGKNKKAPGAHGSSSSLTTTTSSSSTGGGAYPPMLPPTQGLAGPPIPPPGPLPFAMPAAPMMGPWAAPPPPYMGLAAPGPAPWGPTPGVPPSLAAAVGPTTFLPRTSAFPAVPGPDTASLLVGAPAPVTPPPPSSAASAASADGGKSVPPEDGLKLGEMNTRVGLLPGIRPVVFDKHLPNPAEEGKAKRAHRECLSSLTAEEKLERRRERARVYSHMVRRRTEASLKELMGEVERLTVFRLLLEEMTDALLVVSPDPTACVLFASGQGQGAGAGSSGHRPSAMALPPALLTGMLGRPFAECLHPDDVSKALKGVLGVAARPDARYRALLRLRDGEGGCGCVEVEATMKLGTQGVICGLRKAGEPEGFYVAGHLQDERALVA